MKTPTKANGVALAAAAAAVFLAAPMAVSAADNSTNSIMGQCMGVNSCRGHSDCKSVYNVCKGQNECHGFGFKVMSRKQCAAAGGRFTPNANAPVKASHS